MKMEVGLIFYVFLILPTVSLIILSLMLAIMLQLVSLADPHSEHALKEAQSLLSRAKISIVRPLCS